MPQTLSIPLSTIISPLCFHRVLSLYAVAVELHQPGSRPRRGKRQPDALAFKRQDHATTQTGMIFYDAGMTACGKVKMRGLHRSPKRVSGSLRVQRAHASHKLTALMRVLLLIERLREVCGHL